MANTKSLDLESGSSQYAYAADSASLSITGDMTVEFWIKRETAAGSTILSKLYDGGDNNSWAMDFNSDHYPVIYLSSTGTTYLGLSFANATLNSTSVWYHVAFAYDASAGSIELYINGTSVQVRTGFPTSIYDGNRVLYVGRDNRYGQYSDCLVDELRIWNDIRTAQEISDNKSVQLVGNEAGLAAYWQFNDDYLDMTANNNDMTASGSPVFSATVPFTGSVAYTMAAAVGAFVLSGQAVLLHLGTKMVSAVGSFVLSGQAVILRHGSKIVLAAESFILTGQNMLFTVGKGIQTVVGEFVLTGINILFHIVVSVPLTVGDFILSGQAVTLKFGRKMIVAVGEFVLTGQTVILRVGKGAVMAVGEFVLAGQTILMGRFSKVFANVGAFTLTGQTVRFLVNNISNLWVALSKNAETWINKLKS